MLDKREFEMAKDKKRSKKKTTGKIALLAAEVLVLVLVFIIVKVWTMYDRTQDNTEYSDSELGIVALDSEEMVDVFEGEYTNIALFGIDNRSSSNYDSGNSDTIMVLSINNETKEARLVSVYRDTYLLVDDDKYRKANAAYQLGGVSGAIKMLNKNLDLQGNNAIRHYVCVDWNALVEAIDALGGVEIEITDEEVKWINYYVDETAKSAGTTSEYVTESGLVTLNGAQATSYARIRYTSGNDYKRTSRQRIVLQAMLEKAQSASFTALASICNDVVDDVQTSLSLTQMLYLLKDLNSYTLVSTTGFPFDLTTVELSTTGDTVVAVDLYSNVVQLHEYLFEDENYVPSETLLNINNEIINLTGITTDNAILVDTSDLNDTVGAIGTDELTATEEEESTQTTEQED
ncbi:MAG: LCP family protein [Clostridiales bacterium]|nr:LCP family protein [Clostridiales bacterium]